MCLLLQACEEYKAISKKLYEKPTSIEELAELREWIKQIPDQFKAPKVQVLTPTFTYFSFLKVAQFRQFFCIIKSCILHFWVTRGNMIKLN